MNNKRIEWIDICKCIGIFFVVLGHVIIPESIDIWIHSFHMPLFFILSGLCFNEKKHHHFLPFLKSRFKTLVFPYILFSLLLYYLYNIIVHVALNNDFGTCHNLLNCIYTPASTTSCFGAVNWFLPALFISEIVFFFLGKIVSYSRKKIVIIVFLVSLIAFFYPVLTNYYRLPLAIDSMFMGLFFYGFGWLIKGIDYKKIQIFFKKSILLSYFIVAFLLVTSFVLSQTNNMVNMRKLIYGNYFLFIFISIGISFMIVAFSILLNISSIKIKILNILKYIGKNTMVIMLFNGFFAMLYNVFKDHYNFIINNKILLVFNNIIVSIFIIVICLILSSLINRFCPILIGKKKN